MELQGKGSRRFNSIIIVLDGVSPQYSLVTLYARFCKSGHGPCVIDTKGGEVK